MMRRYKKLLLICSFTLVSPSKLLSQPTSYIRWEEIKCPVCGHTVSVSLILNPNNLGGIDKDLYARAVGPQPEFYLINTCPNCGFSGYLSDFKLRFAESDKEKLRKILKLPPNITSQTHQQEIDTLLKYSLAYKTYKILGRSEESRGWIALRGSWVARDLYSTIPANSKLRKLFLEIVRKYPRKKNEGICDWEIRLAKILKSNLKSNENDSWAKTLAIGLLYRRHGENISARPYLESLLLEPKFPQKLKGWLKKLISSIDIERKWQKIAIGNFERAVISGKVKNQNKIIAEYILAELYRRIGEDESAIYWYKNALGKGLPTPLRKWAESQLNILKGNK